MDKSYINFQMGASLVVVALKYGKEYAKNIERLFRLETRDFTSKQFLKGYSPGMEKVQGNDKFPYGWSSLRQFCNENNVQKDGFSTYQMQENGTGLQKTFIKFPDIKTSIDFVAWFIQEKRNGRVGHWYSLDEEDAKRYEKSLSKIKTEFIE